MANRLEISDAKRLEVVRHYASFYVGQAKWDRVLSMSDAEILTACGGEGSPTNTMNKLKAWMAGKVYTSPVRNGAAVAPVAPAETAAARVARLQTELDSALEVLQAETARDEAAYTG